MSLQDRGATARKGGPIREGHQHGFRGVWASSDRSWVFFLQPFKITSGVAGVWLCKTMKRTALFPEARGNLLSGAHEMKQEQVEA